MRENQFEAVKRYLIQEIEAKLARRDQIDQEIHELINQKDTALDHQINALERKILASHQLIASLNGEKRKMNQLLEQFKKEKTKQVNNRNKRMDELLLENEKLSYYECLYHQKLKKLEQARTYEDLEMNEEQLFNILMILDVEKKNTIKEENMVRIK